MPSAVHTLERAYNVETGAVSEENEYELEVLEKYDIEVKSTRRIRGAFFCIGSELKSGRAGDFGDCLQSRSVPFGAAGDYDTKERPMLLKETKLSERRALFYMTL